MTTPETPLPPLWFFAVMAFVMGTICGSFFNVVIYRVPAKKSIVWPGSHCYACGSYIRGYDNVPLLSYLWLRGNCRDCGSHFSARYFLVELLTGLLFLTTLLYYGPSWIVPFHCAFISLLLIGTFTDIDHFIIPDAITLGGLGFALVTALVMPRHAAVATEFNLVRDLYYAFRDVRPPQSAPPVMLTSFGWALASAALGWLLLWGVGLLGSILFRKDAMGAGDVKLFAFLGAYLGAINCLWILFLASLLGSVIGLTLLLAHRLVGKDEFEEIELLPERAVKRPLTTGRARSEADAEGDTGIAPEAEPSQAEPRAQASEPGQGEPADGEGEQKVVLRIARRTSRQLHQLPFGPYIAVAAVLVLFFQGQIDSFARTVLLLPPAKTPEAQTRVQLDKHLDEARQRLWK